MKDTVFLAKRRRSGDFEFNAAVASVFDDMIVRSVPFYTEQQTMIAQLAKHFFIPGSNIYDLGCSTGTTLINLGGHLGSAAQLIGYDNSKPMLERAQHKVAEAGFQGRIRLRHGDLNGDLKLLPLEDASVVVMSWTLQFIRPLQREKLIRWISSGLLENGVLIVADKVLTNSTNLNRAFAGLYYDFKRGNGYSEMEICNKREALENVLIPYRIDENVEMFRGNGFRVVETFFQWYNFVGFICCKTKA